MITQDEASTLPAWFSCQLLESGEESAFAGGLHEQLRLRLLLPWWLVVSPWAPRVQGWNRLPIRTPMAWRRLAWRRLAWWRRRWRLLSLQVRTLSCTLLSSVSGADYTYSWKLDTLSDMIVQPEPQGSEPLLSACKAQLFRPASIRLFIFWKLVRKGLLLQPLFGKMRFCSGSSLYALQ